MAYMKTQLFSTFYLFILQMMKQGITYLIEHPAPSLIGRGNLDELTFLNCACSVG